MSVETSMKKFVDTVAEVLKEQSKAIQDLQVVVHNQGVIIEKLKSVRPELFKNDEEITTH